MDLTKLVEFIPTESIREFIEPGLLRTLSSLIPEANLDKVEMNVFLKLVNGEPNKYFTDRAFLKLLLSRLSLEKKRELERRAGCTFTHLQEACKSLDPHTIKSLLSFFGIEDEGQPYFADALNVEAISPSFGLFPHQRAAAEGVWRHIGRGTSRVLLHMPTGAGKTRTAMHVIARYLNTYEPCIVVWLASSAELLEQAAEAFEMAWKALGNRELSLRRAWGSHEIDLDDFEDGLLVGGLQKLHAFLEKKPNDVFRLARRTKLVVMDEAHQAIAPTYHEVITRLAEAGPSNALVGLSATPGRTWADRLEDGKLAEFFQEKKVTLEIPGYSDPVKYLIDEGYLAKPEFRSLEHRSDGVSAMAGTRDHEYPDDIMEEIGQDTDRNILIIREIQRLILSGHKRIILFAASVSHAENVAVLLEALDISSQVVTGKSSTSARSNAIKRYRRPSNRPVVMCNFGVLTTGFDAPETSAAVIARPTKSLVLFSQMVGRATRGVKAGGNRACVVSTVVDTGLPGFGDMAEAFLNWEDVWSKTE